MRSGPEDACGPLPSSVDSEKSVALAGGALESEAGRRTLTVESDIAAGGVTGGSDTALRISSRTTSGPMMSSSPSATFANVWTAFRFRPSGLFESAWTYHAPSCAARSALTRESRVSASCTWQNCKRPKRRS